MAPPPFPYKSAPNPVVPPQPQATIARQPVMSISYPLGCTSSANLCLDAMPLMNREPEALPDQPGGGYSYTGQGIEYLNMGISPRSAISANDLWSGQGAFFWDIVVDGVTVTTLNAYDGQPGPICVGIPNTFDFTVPHSWWMTATYQDRPAYRDWYVGPGVGIISFGCGAPGCGCSIGWNRADWWNPWVIAHHDYGNTGGSGADPNGPVDRFGNYLYPGEFWGPNVLKQHLRSDDATPCLDAYASTLLDLDLSVEYPAQSYAITTSHQTLPACTVARTYPVFDHTRAHKAAS